MDAISDGAGSKPHTHNGNLAALPAVLAPLCDTANWLIFRWVQNGSESGPSRRSSRFVQLAWPAIMPAKHGHHMLRP